MQICELTPTSIKHDEPMSPGINQYTIGGTVVEAILYANGRWLFRVPTDLPVNGRDWRGPYKSEQAAIDDFILRSARPKITRAELQRHRDNGKASLFNGTESILYLCPLHGSSTVGPYELID